MTERYTEPYSVSHRVDPPESVIKDACSVAVDDAITVLATTPPVDHSRVANPLCVYHGTVVDTSSVDDRTDTTTVQTVAIELTAITSSVKLVFEAGPDVSPERPRVDTPSDSSERFPVTAVESE